MVGREGGGEGTVGSEVEGEEMVGSEVEGDKMVGSEGGRGGMELLTGQNIKQQQQHYCPSVCVPYLPHH